MIGTEGATGLVVSSCGKALEIASLLCSLLHPYITVGVVSLLPEAVSWSRRYAIVGAGRWQDERADFRTVWSQCQ